MSITRRITPVTSRGSILNLPQRGNFLELVTTVYLMAKNCAVRISFLFDFPTLCPPFLNRFLSTDHSETLHWGPFPYYAVLGTAWQCLWLTSVAKSVFQAGLWLVCLTLSLCFSLPQSMWQKPQDPVHNSSLGYKELCKYIFMQPLTWNWFSLWLNHVDAFLRYNAMFL